MKAIEVMASFDDEGKIVFENIPAFKNRKAKLLILFEEEDENGFSRFSAEALNKAYSDKEPDYEFSSLKELNSNYERR